MEETLRRFAQDSGTAYKDFVLRTDLLRERAKVFFDVLMKALDGDLVPLQRDQANAGYDRAMRGFHLGDVLRPQDIFRSVMYELLADLHSKGRLKIANVLKEAHEFYSIMIEAYQQNALSFIRTREEIINEKVNQIQGLYEFTQELLAEPPRSDTVFRRLFEKMTRLFPGKELILAIWEDTQTHLIFHHPEELRSNDLLGFLQEVGKPEAPVYVDDHARRSADVTSSKTKTCVITPLSGPVPYWGLLILKSPSGFSFTEKDSHLIQQLLHLAAVAVENAQMLVEIERKQRELQAMTTKMIEVREEERKKLAADIHDTFAQTLVFLDYRLQYSGEILQKKPEKLKERIAELRAIVKKASDQCRVMISSLRPDLIDTLGLGGALRRLIEEFEINTGIDVETHFSNVRVSGKAKICLFRVAQEALNNISRHSKATRVDFCLRKERDHVLLVVADNGVGFDTSAHWASDTEAPRMGLLFMKERLEALGGSLFVSAHVGNGCRIEASVPCLSKEEADAPH